MSNDAQNNSRSYINSEFTDQHSQLLIRPETENDHSDIRTLQRKAFGDDHVPDLIEALRAAPHSIAPQSYVAEVGSRVVGHVMISASFLDAPQRLVDVMTLSPLGVHPEFQRQGLATRLIHHALEAADASGIPLVFLEGDPKFYGKRGFAAATPLGFRSPSQRIPELAFQVVRLSSYEPWMTGTFVYSQTFWDHDSVGLRPPTISTAMQGRPQTKNPSSRSWDIA